MHNKTKSKHPNTWRNIKGWNSTFQSRYDNRITITIRPENFQEKLLPKEQRMRFQENETSRAKVLTKRNARTIDSQCQSDQDFHMMKLPSQVRSQLKNERAQFKGSRV